MQPNQRKSSLNPLSQFIAQDNSPHVIRQIVNEVQVEDVPTKKESKRFSFFGSSKEQLTVTVNTNFNKRYSAETLLNLSLVSL